MPATHLEDSLAAQLRQLARQPELLKRIFDSLTDTIIYFKDTEARYLLVNETLALRSGLGRDGLIGLTGDQVFKATNPGSDELSLAVVQTKVAVVDRLRLYATPSGQRIWCLSSLYPIIDANGAAIGLVGIARDLPRPDERHDGYRRLLGFSQYVQQHLSRKILIAKAAQYAGISVDTLERYTKEVFHLTPKQLLMKLRIDRACLLLEKADQSITDVAVECGYSDHSAFSRQFKAATLLTPRMYREVHGQRGGVESRP